MRDESSPRLTPDRLLTPTSELRHHLERHEAIADATWLASLNQRKLAELQFHDRDRNPSEASKLDSDTFEKIYGNRRFYSVVSRSKDYVAAWINERAPNRVVLDYACGNGATAILAARAGAELAIGLDISRVSIDNARDMAVKAGVSNNTWFIQGDCENTGLPPNCVDLVICSGMLHHLDLNYAFPELRRIMKPGAVALAIEALDYNPAIKLYRLMTPRMRTEWEKAHILSHKDLRFARRFFRVSDVRYWHLLSIPAALLAGSKVFPTTLAFGNLLDGLVLRIPGLRLMAWMFTFELQKTP